MPKGEYLQYGGQAIVEGVMMRSPRYFSVACRAPNGEIVLKTEALEKTWIGRQKWLKLPFFRGSLAILDAMALGTKAMRFASNIQLDPEYQPPPEEGAEIQPGAAAAAAPSKRIQDLSIVAAMVAGLVLGFFIFNYLPNMISELGGRWLGVRAGMVLNFLAEVIKVIIFIGYIWLIGRVPEIGEVFKYHGAEHKAINTLEADQDLTFENCARQTRLHPRCGTSFAIVVLIVSMVLFTFVPRYPVTGQQGNAFVDVTVRVGIELCILPIVAGIAYELIRIAGRFRNSATIKAVFWPGLMSQYLTTREPNEQQIEVALLSLQAVVDAEEKGLAPEPAELTMEDAVETVPIN